MRLPLWDGLIFFDPGKEKNKQFLSSQRVRTDLNRLYDCGNNQNPPRHAFQKLLPEYPEKVVNLFFTQNLFHENVF